MSIKEHIDIDLTRISEYYLAYRIIKKEDHQQEHIMTQGFCWFNHIIGLPSKEAIEKPIFGYERIMYDVCSFLKIVIH